jgi:hypothetical protein
MRDTVKPRITLRTIAIMSNDIAITGSGVPDWARKASTGISFGNIGKDDLKPPRLKVLAGQSPEVMDGTPGAVPGNFWMTILNVNLGKEVTGTPILHRKSYFIWAPRMAGSDQKGPLAVASDGEHWDTPNQKFEVWLDGRKYVWETKRTVFENGLHRFGTQQPENPKSKPVATLTYDVLWLIDLPDGGRAPCLFTSSRTGATPTQNFFSTVRSLGIDQIYQRYRIVVKKKTGPTGDPYFTYEYQYIGSVKEEEQGQYLAVYNNYAKDWFQNLKTWDEADGASEERPAAPVSAAETNDDIDQIPF